MVERAVVFLNPATGSTVDEARAAARAAGCRFLIFNDHLIPAAGTFDDVTAFPIVRREWFREPTHTRPEARRE